MTRKYYAGVGSRRTPEPVLERMGALAGQLQDLDWILRSGAALGADTAFEQGSDHQAYVKERRPEAHKQIMLPWKRYNQNPSLLHPELFPYHEKELELARDFHPNWSACSNAIRSLHTRNGRILYGIDCLNEKLVKFVVCWTPGGEIAGGTGQALRIAQGVGIRIFNFGEAKSEADIDKMVLDIIEFQKAL